MNNSPPPTNGLVVSVPVGYLPPLLTAAKTNIIQVYASAADKADDLFGKIYEDLTNIIKSLNKDAIMLVIRDLAEKDMKISSSTWRSIKHSS